MYKAVTILGLFAFILVGCKNQSDLRELKLSVVVENAEGRTVYIERPDYVSGTEVLVDSFKVTTREARFDMMITDTVEEMYLLKTMDRRIAVRFVNDTSAITIKCNYYEPDSFSVIGSRGSQEFYAFQKEASAKSKELYKGLDSVEKSDHRLEEAQAQFTEWSRNRIAALNNPIVTAYYFSYIDFGRDIDAYERYFNKVFAKFSFIPRWKELNRKTQQFIQNFRKEIEIGDRFPNCKLVSVSGTTDSILPVTGKYRFVDFWASWFVPSIQEIEFKQSIYKKYAGRGLNMVSVSLEPDIKPWQQYLKMNSMLWPQYIDPTVWSGTVAETYHIDSIPYNFILDEQNKVVAKNLYGKKLTQWMDSAFVK